MTPGTINEPSSFSQAETIAHKLLCISVWQHIRTAPLLVTLSVPVICALLIPFLLLDLAVVIYQAICFPIYGTRR